MLISPVMSSQRRTRRSRRSSVITVSSPIACRLLLPRPPPRAFRRLPSLRTTLTLARRGSTKPDRLHDCGTTRRLCTARRLLSADGVRGARGCFLRASSACAGEKGGAGRIAMQVARSAFGRSRGRWRARGTYVHVHGFKVDLEMQGGGSWRVCEWVVIAARCRRRRRSSHGSCWNSAGPHCGSCTTIFSHVG
ncbi:hypothetical protein C8J57DRAFT_228308 [Mycena rebaudengoi]|nr:hypothetical protein C8J57DRAFT_228308 [Mycena rebaudengoi]